MIKDIRITEVPPQKAMAVREAVANDQIQSKMGEFFGEVMSYMVRNGIQPTGPPFAFYHSYDQNITDMEVGFPCDETKVGEGRVMATTVPGGKIVTATHIGPYDKLIDSYNEMLRWMSERSLRPKKEMWERYLTDPASMEDPEKYVTEMFWPYE
ncbi:MAG: GyrI-like domain-containing protein [Methanomassiliicoccales archaeon]|nr:MAG: GyrI-like domain-containing protein [Methanomassiliicoccales archaeon]